MKQRFIWREAYIKNICNVQIVKETERGIQEALFFLHIHKQLRKIIIELFFSNNYKTNFKFIKVYNPQ